MIFTDLVSLKLPDICLTGEEKPRKKITQETCADRGSNPGPLRDRRACYHLLHSGGRNNNNNNNNNNNKKKKNINNNRLIIIFRIEIHVTSVETNYIIIINIVEVLLRRMKMYIKLKISIYEVAE